MTNTTHKVVTRCARKASKIVTMRSGMKRLAHRIYRRTMRMVDHTAEDPNYEPHRGARVTGWDVA